MVFGMCGELSEDFNQQVSDLNGHLGGILRGLVVVIFALIIQAILSYRLLSISSFEPIIVMHHTNPCFHVRRGFPTAHRLKDESALGVFKNQ